MWSQYAAGSARCPHAAAVHPLTREMRWIVTGRRCCTVRVRHPTPELFRGLARSSPWRWRALSFELHRRPLHGPDHVVLGRLVRGVGLEVRLPHGELQRHDAVRGTIGSFGPGIRSGTRVLPYAWELPVEVDADDLVVTRPSVPMADDPMWQDYQFVAMLDPVELADGMPRDLGPTGTRMPCARRPWTSTGSTRRRGWGARRGGPR